MVKRMSATNIALVLSMLEADDWEAIMIALDEPIDIKTTDNTQGEPLNIIQFVEQTTLLRFMDYHLLEPIRITRTECPCCHNRASVGMEYCNMKDFKDSHNFNLCLYCFNAVKMTAFASSAEGDA